MLRSKPLSARWHTRSRARAQQIAQNHKGTRYTSHVTRHTSHVTRHTSHVTRHVTHHTSHVTRITCWTLSAPRTQTKWGEGRSQFQPKVTTEYKTLRAGGGVWVTQWPSSGKWRNRDGTRRRCSAVKVDMASVSTTLMRGEGSVTRDV